MKYIITKENMTFIIDNQPFSLGRDDRRFEEVKTALENFQPDYIVKEILNPSEEVEKAKEMLNGVFKEEEA